MADPSQAVPAQASQIAPQPSTPITPAPSAVPPVNPSAAAASAMPEEAQAPSVPRESLKMILKDFAKGTRELLRFVFIEQRSERRKELVESLRFYVTYK